MNRERKKNITFFIHIPKTAGTSFRKALQQNESVHMIYDYGEKSAESSRELLNMDPLELTPENNIFHPEKHNFLCGHVSYQRYARLFSGVDVVAIVRNPVERLLSEYQHLRRHLLLTQSFEEFFSTNAQQNKQWKMLQGLDLEKVGLIGLTSHYRYFVELFSDKFALPMQTTSINKAPVADVADRLNIDARSIKAAYELNEKDISSFFKLAYQFAKRVMKHGYNTIPEDGTLWNCRVTKEKQIMGWVSCSEKDCYFVELKVNGEKRVIVALDQYRKDIVSKNLSLNPVCGFRYPISLLGAEEGDTLHVGILGTHMFEKALLIE